MDTPQEYFLFKINVLKRMFLIILGACLFSALLGQKEFALGFIVGGLLSVAVFSLLYKYVLVLRGNQAQGQRKRFLMARSLVLYLIMGLALFIGIKKGIPVFLGTAAGLLSLKIAIFIQGFKERYAS